MTKKTEKQLMLEGLGCANCAAKIEKEINALPEIKIANIDFVAKKLTLEVNNTLDLDSIIETTSKIANRIESGIKVIDINKQDENNYNINKSVNIHKTVKLSIGTILFLIAILLKLPFWIEFGLFITAYIVVGGEILLKALKNIIHGQVFDENFLMSIATIGAFAIKEFPEGVAVMLFYQIGELFQDIAVNHSRKSISNLMDIRPDFANLKINDEFIKVSPDKVKIGDIIIVKPGEKIPLDGKIITGRSTLNVSALTGESLPKEVEIGNEVLSGSINNNGLLTLEVTKTFSESTVSKILDLVQNASSKKAPTESFITKFARLYTPFVVFTAAGLAIIPPLFINDALFSEWISRALVFLVISCPCALVISIPLGFFGGIGGASKKGILIKGGNYLEALNNVDTIVFDKTGTLTKGIFSVTNIVSSGLLTESKLLEYAAYAESHSSHPIALSIQRAYGKQIDTSIISDYEEVSGYGIKVIVKGKKLLVGNINLLLNNNVPVDLINSLGTIVYIAVDGNYAGYIVVSDEIKEDSINAINGLRRIGVKKLAMLTGDIKPVGEQIGKKLGLDEVYCELLPNEKIEQLEILEKQKSKKGNLVYVGDGINDAPVLARADVGIAMGGIGSDAAIEAADVVLMTDEPSKLVTAIKTAKRTRRIVMQNIVFAIGIKVVVLLLGALGMANMWEAVFADVGVALIAVLNSTRALNIIDK